jgi:hypothetical protein
MWVRYPQSVRPKLFYVRKSNLLKTGWTYLHHHYCPLVWTPSTAINDVHPAGQTTLQPLQSILFSLWLIAKPTCILPLSHLPIVDCTSIPTEPERPPPLRPSPPCFRSVSVEFTSSQDCTAVLSTRQQRYPPEPCLHHWIVFKMKGTWLESKNVSWIDQNVPIFVNANVSH